MKKIILLFILLSVCSFLFAEQFIYRDYHYYDYVEYLMKKGYICLRNNDIPISVDELLGSIEKSAIMSMETGNINETDKEIMVLVYEDLKSRWDFMLRDEIEASVAYGDSISWKVKNALLIICNLPKTDIQVLIDSRIPYGEKTYADTIRAHEWKGTRSAIDRAVIHYGSGSNYIAAGRLLPAWGQGFIDNMFLSRYTNPYDGLLFNLSKGIFDFSYFSAIITPSHSIFRNDSFKTYASFHKVGIQLPYEAYVSFKEIIIYASKIPETRYINPFALYYFTQWNGRVDDNVIWSIEIRSKKIPFAAEIFIDDFQYDEQRAIAPDKIGLQLSGWLPLYFDGLMMDWEYSMITKWTGTHEYDACIYKYYEDPMMHYIGPDSDISGIRIKYITDKINTSYSFIYKRNGEGTLEMSHEEEDTDPHPPFPSGIVEKTMTHSLTFEYRPIEMIGIECGAEIINIDNNEHIENEKDREFNIYIQGEISI